jgi:hypothetical protein
VASQPPGSTGSTSGFDRRSGSGVVGCGAQLAGPRNAGCRCASIDGKIMRKTVDVYAMDRLVASYPIVVKALDRPTDDDFIEGIKQQMRRYYTSEDIQAARFVVRG